MPQSLSQPAPSTTARSAGSRGADIERAPVILNAQIAEVKFDSMTGNVRVIHLAFEWQGAPVLQRITNPTIERARARSNSTIRVLYDPVRKSVEIFNDEIPENYEKKLSPSAKGCIGAMTIPLIIITVLMIVLSRAALWSFLVAVPLWLLSFVITNAIAKQATGFYFVNAKFKQANFLETRVALVISHMSKTQKNGQTYYVYKLKLSGIQDFRYAYTKDEFYRNNTLVLTQHMQGNNYAIITRSA
jgi:hypothetical protein